MNKGRQKKTTLKYLLYLYVLCKKQNIVYKQKVNIKNRELMEAFHISYTDSDLHQHLEDIGVLVCDDETHYHYANGGKAKGYTINANTYMQHLKSNIYLFPKLYDSTVHGNKYGELFYDELGIINDRYRQLIEYDNSMRFWGVIEDNTELASLNIRKVETDSNVQDFLIEDVMEVMNRDSCAFTFDLFSDTDTPKDSSYTILSTDSESYKKIGNVFKQFIVPINEYDKFFGSEQWIKATNRKEFNKDDWERIWQAYKDCVKGTTLIRLLYEETQKLASLNYEIHLKIKVTTLNGSKGFHIHNTGRQNNILCQLIKADRKIKLEEEGYDANFDLHSAIYAVARLMNTGTFDPDWDIKAELLNNNSYSLLDGTSLTKKQLKSVLYRTFFAKSLNDSYKKYVNAYNGIAFDKNGNYKQLSEKEEKKRKELPIMSEETYTKLFNDCQALIGGSEAYYYTVFYIESLIECRGILTMLVKGYDVKNVYDCFYFKSNQTSISEVKQIIYDCAMGTYNDLNQKSLWY